MIFEIINIEIINIFDFQKNPETRKIKYGALDVFWSEMTMILTPV